MSGPARIPVPGRAKVSTTWTNAWRRSRHAPRRRRIPVRHARGRHRGLTALCLRATRRRLRGRQVQLHDGDALRSQAQCRRALPRDVQDGPRRHQDAPARDGIRLRSPSVGYRGVKIKRHQRVPIFGSSAKCIGLSKSLSKASTAASATEYR